MLSQGSLNATVSRPGDGFVPAETHRPFFEITASAVQMRHLSAEERHERPDHLHRRDDPENSPENGVSVLTPSRSHPVTDRSIEKHPGSITQAPSRARSGRVLLLFSHRPP